MNNSVNSSNSGLFGKLTSAVSGAVEAVTGNKKNNSGNTRKQNNSMKNNSMKNMNTVVTNSTMNFGFKQTPNQTGGMAPVNFRYPANMEQPSRAVMEWATTAGVPQPPESEMRNVAHGGSRRNRTRRNKRRNGGKRSKKTNATRRNKTKKGGNRRNRSRRNRNRRN